MGIICQKKENLNNYTSTIKKTKQSLVRQDDFKFIMKNPNSINSQCLLIYVDTQCNVRKNQFLAKISQTIGPRLQDYLDLELMGKCMNPGDCLIIDADIRQLKFKHVAILCVNIWTGTNLKLQQPLKQDIQGALSAIKEKNIKSVCITILNSQLGIPNQVGYKALGRAAVEMRDQFTQIAFWCHIEQNKQALIEVINEQKYKIEQLTRKSIQSVENSQNSNYY